MHISVSKEIGHINSEEFFVLKVQTDLSDKYGGINITFKLPEWEYRRLLCYYSNTEFEPKLDADCSQMFKFFSELLKNKKGGE